MSEYNAIPLPRKPNKQEVDQISIEKLQRTFPFSTRKPEKEVEPEFKAAEFVPQMVSLVHGNRMSKAEAKDHLRTQIPSLQRKSLFV